MIKQLNSLNMIEIGFEFIYFGDKGMVLPNKKDFCLASSRLGMFLIQLKFSHILTSKTSMLPPFF